MLPIHPVIPLMIAQAAWSEEVNVAGWSMIGPRPWALTMDQINRDNAAMGSNIDLTVKRCLIRSTGTQIANSDTNQNTIKPMKALTVVPLDSGNVFGTFSIFGAMARSIW